jgi:hypothetical protein
MAAPQRAVIRPDIYQTRVRTACPTGRRDIGAQIHAQAFVASQTGR